MLAFEHIAACFPEMAEDPYSPPEPPEPGWPNTGGGSLVAPEVSRRVRSILDGVEREAAQLRNDAREEARRYLEQARRYVDGMVAERQGRIAALSDEIIARSEVVLGRLDEAAPVRQGFDNLVRALGDAAERLADEVEDMRFGNVGPPPYWQSTPAAPSSFEQGEHETRYEEMQPAPDAWPAPEGEPPEAGAEQPSEPSTPSDEIRKLAMQMAGAGHTRGSVAGYLRDQVGLPVDDELLDGIFGEGSADDSRVDWAG